MTMINQSFQAFVEEIQAKGSVYEAIEYAQRLYSLKTHKIHQISAAEALKIYQAIYLKFYKGHSQTIKTNWYQNELRIFVWALACYIYLHKQKIQDLGEADWDYFQKLFDRKDRGLFEYQCKYLCANTKGKNWSKQQQQLLRKIMENKINTAKWNEVSKQLFQISQKKFFRTAKQCRERWNNHLDPTKIKGFWRAQQCLLMFQYVKQHGKKWANLVKLLNETRNQHAIKNKFNSIIKKHRKTSNTQIQNQIYNQIITRIQKTLQNRAIFQNADLSFDLQECQDQIQIRKQRNQYLKIQNSCHKTTQNFLKILQKYNSDNPEGSSKSQIKLQQNQKTLIQGSSHDQPQGSVNKQNQAGNGRRVEVYAYPVLFYKFLSSNEKPNNAISTGYQNSNSLISGSEKDYLNNMNLGTLNKTQSKYAVKSVQPNMYLPLPVYYNLNSTTYGESTNMTTNTSNINYKIDIMGGNTNQRNQFQNINQNHGTQQSSNLIKHQLNYNILHKQEIYEQFQQNQQQC